MKILKAITRHWYNFGIFVAAGSLIFLLTDWIGGFEILNVLQKIQLASFIAILVHQFEEYGFPGGEPMIMNKVLQASDMPDRYPLNSFSAMFTNVSITYTVYLLPIFFPNVIWLGIAPILMGMMQFAVHGIMTNVKMKSIYNPGLGAVVFLHIPIGIIYFWYISTNGLATGYDWLFGVLFTVGVTVLVLGVLTYIVLPNRNTKFVFDEKELQRFKVEEKLEKKGIVISSEKKGVFKVLEKLKKGKKQ